MNILFFTHYYPPEVNAPASRTSEHCRAWARAGHDVTVVTCAPNHPKGEIYPGYSNRLFRVETVDGVRVVRVWTYLAANEGFARRIANYISYLVTATLAALRLPRPDIYVSTSPQFFCGLTGFVAATLRRRPWVLEIRDLWPESIVTVGAMRKGVVIAVLEWLECFAYRRANRIVSVTDSFVAHIAARCQGAEKIDVIKNGVDLTLFKRSADADTIKREIGFEGRFVAAYVGTHGMAHGLDTILDAAALLKDNPRIGFLMVGGGAEQAGLEARAAARNLANLRILGQRPKEQMPAVWAATDASLILLKQSDTFLKVLPSKTFEAMAMQCPIVLGVAGEAKALVEEAAAGIAIKPESADELAAAVVKLGDDPALCALYGSSGLEFVRANFDRNEIAARYLRLLERTAGGAIDRSVEQKRCVKVWRTMQRAVAFGRHVPMRKLARRVELMLRRRVRDGGLALALSARPAPIRSNNTPLPIFPPRKGLAPVARLAGGLRFKFLHHSVDMPGPGVDWSAQLPGAAHQLWRMNLHYMEYLECVDDRAFEAFVADWIAANPARKPGAWRDAWNSYALSLRLVVWLQQLARRSSRISTAVRVKIEASIVEQTRFLVANLETDLGGNHLIKNIKALVWASASFCGPEAAQWRSIALALLDAELRRQILADGVHDERSPSYHAQVFADLLECRHALGADPLGGRLDDGLAGMAQALADLTHPDGGPALFNDAGLTMAYAAADCLAVYEMLYGSRPAPRRAFVYAAAGYFGLRNDVSYLVADCGRIAPDDLPAHGHGDVLSFEWSVRNRRFVVDQGVFEYTAGRRRQAARSAASHNTLCFDDADQADFFDAFRCGRRPDVAVRACRADADGLTLEGTHDGFSNLPGAPRHVRRFEAGPASLRIVDRIEGRSDRPARISFLLHPDVTPTGGPNGLRLVRDDACAVVVATRKIDIEDAVWWPDMGREVKTRRLVVIAPPGTAEIETDWRIETTRDAIRVEGAA